MKRLVRRLFLAVFTLWLVTIVIFASSEALPGDAAEIQLPRELRTEENVARLRDDLGLDNPPLVRYQAWLSRGLGGDWGTSYVTRRPVITEVRMRLRNSLLLGAIAIGVGIPLAIGLGVLAAVARDRLPDLTLSSVALIGMSIPDFVLGSLLIYLFAITLGWLPAITTVPIDAPLGDLLPNLWLPAVTLIVGMVAYLMRLVRASLISVLESEFVQAARLRGLSNSRVVLIHACPSALLPVVQVTALTIAGLSAGVVIVEAVFNYPGMGTLLIGSVSARDLPVVQFTVLLAAVIYIVMSLLADLVSVVFNPRLREPGAGGS